MDNQHRKIKGYRELNEDEIATMNRIKELAAQVGQLVETLRGEEVGSEPIMADQRWVNIGATQLQQGFMALTRAVAKPEFF
jgi:hypothetical protein